MRSESDEMGEVHVPDEALYGAQTQRAIENFPISGRRFGRDFIRALGLIKKAAAMSNVHFGVLDAETANAVAEAAAEVISGKHDSHFVVDVFQTGSGTSTNMNANEVIARVAGMAGARPIHPNDHVNRSQSSNDVIPAAMHLAAAETIEHKLIPAISLLEETLLDKAKEFDAVIKTGRTHLQDAVPMYLGDEMGGYARQVRRAAEGIRAAREGLWELALGGTAIGTGLNAPAGFGKYTIAILAEWTGLPFREPTNRYEAQSARDAAAIVSGSLRNYAIALTKIGNDLRLMGSGPRCGFGELRLPPVQPGSSIMPGKVNPVIIESTLMVCAEVMGHDTAIAWCCANGQLELNAMMPLMIYDLLDSIALLAAASENLARRCVAQLGANQERMASLVGQSEALAAALTAEIGHSRAADIARKASETGKTIREIAGAESGLSPEKLDKLLDVEKLARGEEETSGFR
ncbi:MAG: class II fumarate hydratase [Acidobacteria bacterium]|nr:class II fumarate hydratase [Acidobacteriota bacterium]